MKFCVDCRWFRPHSEHWALEKCARQWHNHVDGTPVHEGIHLAVWTARHHYCGPSAAGFEKKEEQPNQYHDQSI